MPSFLDKLKKGMESAEIPAETEAAPQVVETAASKMSEETPAPEEEKKPRRRRKVAKAVENQKTEKMENNSEETEKEIIEKFKKSVAVEASQEEPAAVAPSSAAENLAGDPPKGKNWFEPEGQLAVDVYQTDGYVVVQAAIAGVKPEEIDITIEKDMVIIKGERNRVAEEKKENYFYQECYWGKFSREIILPVEIDAGHAEASMKNGILTIKIPKIERQGKKKLVIK